MALPLLLLAGAAVSGIAGLKKGNDARLASRAARDAAIEAAAIFDRAKDEVEKGREAAALGLEQVGALRLDIWAGEMRRFDDSFGALKDVELTGEAADDALAQAFVAGEELALLRTASLDAADLVGGGLGAVGSGALIGVAAYGGTMTFGAASTGVAISGLSGVAATNATLAWLGGGSLAAGGFGMAGGVAVLGGLVAGPALLVGGWALSAKAEANLAKARASRAQAREAAAEMKLAATALRMVEELSGQYRQALERLRPIFGAALDRLDGIIAEAGEQFPTYSIEQKQAVWIAAECAALMKTLLATPLLDSSGGLDEAARAPLERAMRFEGVSDGADQE